MKAAILTELNKPLVVDEVVIPKLGVGQVLVEVHYSGICGAQLGEISGAKGEDKYLPHLLGHEGSGRVVGVGLGVTQVKVGDHVVMHWRKGEGIEAKPPGYGWNGGIAGGGWVTTFNEMAVVSENRLTPYNPDGVPFNVAALMGCAVTTGLGLINNEAQLKMGQSILITGCGGVGLNVIQGAKMVSAYPIIAVDVRNYTKLKRARTLGATHTIDANEADVREEVYRIAGNDGVDVFVDTTGLSDVINEGYVLTAPGGKGVLVGQPSHELSLTLNYMRQHFRGKTLMDSQGGLTNPTVDIPRYLNLYRAGKLRLDWNIMTQDYPLEKINDALGTLREGLAGRVMVKMQ